MFHREASSRRLLCRPFTHGRSKSDPLLSNAQLNNAQIQSPTQIFTAHVVPSSASGAVRTLKAGALKSDAAELSASLDAVRKGARVFDFDGE